MAWVPIGKVVVSGGIGVDTSAAVFEVVYAVFVKLVAQEKVLLDSTVGHSRGSGARQYIAC